MRIADQLLSRLFRSRRPPSTERLDADQTIAMLRRAYADIQDMVIVYSMTGEALYANDRALALLGIGDVGGHPTLRAGLTVYDPSGNRIEQAEWPVFRALRGENVVDCDLIVRVPHFPPDQALRHARISAIQTTFGGLSREPMVMVSISDTTRFMEAQARLRESEEVARGEGALLAAVMDALPIAVVTADRHGRPLRTNAASRALAATLRHASEAGSHAPAETLDPDSGARIADDDLPLTRAVEQGAVTLRRRIDVRADDGGLRNLCFSAAPVRDAAGEIVGGVVACEDVTDLEAALRAINDRETRLRLLIDGARDHAFFMLDRDGRVATWSAAASRLKQYHEADVLGAPWSIFFVEEDVATDLPARLLATARAMGTAYHQGWRRRRDGSRFWADAVLSAIFEQDELVGFAEVARDLTEQRRSQADLRLRNEALRAVSQGILVVDARSEGQPIILVSGGFEALTGYRADEVLGQNCRLLQGPRTAPDDVRRIREDLAAGRACSVEILNYRKDGSTFWNALSISPIRDDQGEVEKFIGVMADVTERRDLEERLRQSLKMDAIGRLAGGIAHDFNNILTIINGNVEELRDDWPPGSVLRDRLDLIHRAGSRAELLTHQLLTFSKRSRVTMSGIDLVEVVDNMRSLLATLIDESVTLDIRLADGLWPVAADRSQMEQVLLNLVINARDAAREGGSILIEAANLTGGLAGDGASRDGVAIRLTDDGIGMPPDVRARAFEPFFTTKGEAGNGLGLATVFGIVTQAGGTIDLTSEVGTGTTVEIVLPAAAAVAPAALPPSPPRPGSVEGLVVLLAEDNDDVRLLIARTLERAQVEVHAFANGLDALHFVRSDRRRVDVLISDVVMPSLGGVSLLDAAAAAYPGLRTLFVTGYNDKPLSLDPGSVHLLHKPFTGRKLLSALENLMTA